MIIPCAIENQRITPIQYFKWKILYILSKMKKNKKIRHLTYVHLTVRGNITDLIMETIEFYEANYNFIDFFYVEIYLRYFSSSIPDFANEKEHRFFIVTI